MFFGSLLLYIFFRVSARLSYTVSPVYGTDLKSNLSKHVKFTRLHGLPMYIDVIAYYRSSKVR